MAENAVTWGWVKRAALAQLFMKEADAADSEEQTAFPYLASQALQLLRADSPVPCRAAVSLRTEGVLAADDLPDDCAADAAVNAVLPDETRLRFLPVQLPIALPRGTGSVTLHYVRAPEIVDADTADDYVLRCGAERAVLLPLYMAGMLLAEEDAVQAQLLLDAFARGRAALQPYAGTVRVGGACPEVLR